MKKWQKQQVWARHGGEGGLQFIVHGGGLVHVAGSSMLMLLLVRVSLLSSPPDICLSNWHFHIHKPGVFINILKLTNISYNKFIIK